MLPIVWSGIETLNRKEIENPASTFKKCSQKVYENVPFYRKLFKEKGVDIDSVRSLSYLSKIPFTTKNDLRENYPYGLFTVSLEDIVEVHASGGTTGKPTVISYTSKDVEN